MYQLYINHIIIYIIPDLSEKYVYQRVQIHKPSSAHLICSQEASRALSREVFVSSMAVFAVGPSGLWEGGFSPSQENTQQDKGASLQYTPIGAHGKLDQMHGKKPSLFRPPCGATFLTSVMPRPRTAWGADGVHPQQQSIS